MLKVFDFVGVNLRREYSTRADVVNVTKHWETESRTPKMKMNHEKLLLPTGSSVAGGNGACLLLAGVLEADVFEHIAHKRSQRSSSVLRSAVAILRVLHWRCEIKDKHFTRWYQSFCGAICSMPGSPDNDR